MKDVIMGLSVEHAMFTASAAISSSAMAMIFPLLPFFMV